jgi:lysophospholipase L1-like esterase
MKRRWMLFIAALVFVSAPLAQAQLNEGDLVAIVGDSITEQKDYSVNIQSYLLMCQPQLKVNTVQFGWGGETSWGYKGRMANDTLPFKPTVATTCFGMNDGGYGPLDENRAKMYREAQREIVRKFKDAGVRFIVLGSPGCVDADTFRNDPAAAEVYNKTLGQLRDIDREVAAEEKVTFADVFAPMVDVMTKAKAKYGKQYHVGGGDGVHPSRNGHLVMAYGFLKGLGCDGDLGTIRIDEVGNKAEATGGHKVVSASGGAVEIESLRYPFCFYGDPKSPDATAGVIEFLPFNEELNRLTLIVTNTKSDKVKVTWGDQSKEFAAADLAKGINLAAEFLQNPFSEPFAKAQNAIRNQQNFETPLVKNLLHNLPQYEQAAPEEKEALQRIAARLIDKDKALREASTAAVVPVTHTLKIESLPARQ